LHRIAASILGGSRQAVAMATAPMISAGATPMLP
jgi:hypothetical protein